MIAASLRCMLLTLQRVQVCPQICHIRWLQAPNTRHAARAKSMTANVANWATRSSRCLGRMTKSHSIRTFRGSCGRSELGQSTTSSARLERSQMRPMSGEKAKSHRTRSGHQGGCAEGRGCAHFPDIAARCEPLTIHSYAITALGSRSSVGKLVYTSCPRKLHSDAASAG